MALWLPGPSAPLHLPSVSLGPSSAGPDFFLSSSQKAHPPSPTSVSPGRAQRHCFTPCEGWDSCVALISCGREKHETRWEQSLVTWGSICLRQARDYPLSSEGVKKTQIVLDLSNDSLILPRTPSPKSLQSPLQSGPGSVSEQTLGAPSVPAGLCSGLAALLLRPLPVPRHLGQGIALPRRPIASSLGFSAG